MQTSATSHPGATADAASASSSRIPFFDALKAIASQLIVLHHLIAYGPMSEVARRHRPAHAARRRGEGDGQQEAAQEGGIHLLDVVGDPDRRQRVVLEQPVDPALVATRAAAEGPLRVDRRLFALLVAAFSALALVALPLALEYLGAPARPRRPKP